MIVEQARHEGAYNEIVPFEGLVYRRRLVDAPGDRFEIFDVEDPRIEIAIPPNNVKGMVIQDVFAQPVADLDAHFKFPAFGVCLQFLRDANIALAIGSMLKQLAKVIAVTLGWLDLGGVLDCKESRFIAINMHLPSCCKWDHDVIAFAE